MQNIIFIAFGGALGAVFRFLTFEAVIKISRGTNYVSFPFHTLTANILGSFLAGILYYFIIKDFDSFDLRLKNFLMVGFLGAFTTFSAFSLDFFRLFNASQYGFAAIYVFSSVVLSLLALFFGFYLMKIIF